MGLAMFEKLRLRRRRYSGDLVHGLVLLGHQLQSPLAVGCDLHLVAEPHVMFYVLAAHADGGSTSVSSFVTRAMSPGLGDAINANTLGGISKPSVHPASPRGVRSARQLLWQS